MTDAAPMIDALIQREGGYVNNPNDSGGETNYGITVAKARAWGYLGPMLALPRALAVTIYTHDYWTGPGLDQVDALMPKLAAELFDTGVNMGPNMACKFLQRALNVLNDQAKDYPDLFVDGALGKMSFYALKMFSIKRGPNAEPVLLRLCDAQKAVRYIEIAEQNAKNEDFEFGWILNRVGVGV